MNALVEVVKLLMVLYSIGLDNLAVQDEKLVTFDPVDVCLN